MRGIVVAGLLVPFGIALTASAEPFLFQSGGYYSAIAVASPPGSSIELLATNVPAPGPYPFTGVSMDFFRGELRVGTPVPVSGDIRLLGPGTEDSLVGSFSGSITLGGGTPPWMTLDGAFSLTSGHGAYAGLSAVGDISGWLLEESPDGGLTGLVIQGNTIPAPGGLALLGVGALGVSRRRRR